MSNQQLLLDLRTEQAPTLENFITGDNRELVARLRAFAGVHCFDAIYLWGPAGSGKSHLLTATAAAQTKRPVVHLDAEKVGAGMTAPGGGLLVIDNVERLGADAQVTLFRLFNSARFLGLAMLLSGNAPPLQLNLREDLRTRIGQMLIYEIKPLSDDDKAAALARHALLRGMAMEPGVVQYLLRHGRRDLPSLLAMLNHLDRASLEQQRLPTVPLLRELLQTHLDIDTP
jgi:DnaA family protein